MRLSSSTVAQIKGRIDIEELVSRYLDVKRKGGRLWACCPFHEERTPSFTVDRSRNIFKCFGCGKGGDGISFLQELEGIGYVEALVTLSKLYGVELVYEKGGGADNSELKSSLHSVLEAAATHYCTCLSSAADARAYVSQRGFSEDILNVFRVGYGLSGLRKVLSGYSLSFLEKSGLCFGSNMGYRDRFASRLTFPIRNLSGFVIGFGARRLSDRSSEAKYINSPETPVYKKSEVLYGLYESRKVLQKCREAYLVEGYTDVLGMHQHGYRACVAPCGTAFTLSQARILRRFVDKAILLFDSDEAGKRAVLLAGDCLLGADIEARVLRLPSSEDPHSFLQKEGREGFARYADARTQSFLLYKAEVCLSRSGGTAHGQSGAWKEILSSVSLIKDYMTQEFAIRELVSAYDVSETMLREVLQSQRSKGLAEGQPLPEVSKKEEADKEEEEAGGSNAGIEVVLFNLLLRYGSEKMPAAFRHQIRGEGIDKSDSDCLSGYVLGCLAEERKEGNTFFHSGMNEFMSWTADLLSKGEPLPSHKDCMERKEGSLSAFTSRYLEIPVALSEKWPGVLNGSVVSTSMDAFHLARRNVLLLKQAYIRQSLSAVEAVFSDSALSPTERKRWSEKRSQLLLQGKTLALLLHSAVSALPVDG